MMTENNMIRILMAEDSQVVGMLLKAIFDAEPDMKVVGIAATGREAVKMTHDLKPDLITMDIRMPEMDGFEATRMIMSTTPTPIVVISASTSDLELKIAFRAIEEGALSVIEKPHGMGHPDFEKIRHEIVETVRAMAEIKVVRRRRPPVQEISAHLFEKISPDEAGSYEVVAIGCSTGGPQALQAILSMLPQDYPIPITVVQHIAKGFVTGLVEWLKGSCLLNVKLAEDGEPLHSGTAYFAPDERHLTVIRSNGNLAVALTDDPSVNRFKPSATPLLESVARVCGNKGVGAILTGMGGDGAEGLQLLHKAKGHTFIQDESSSVVFGMPAQALALKAVDQILELNQIPGHLIQCARK